MSSYAPARISLDRYRIPHALLIYPTHPFVHVLVLPSPSSPLISLRPSHLNDSAYPARPVSPFNMFLILHPPAFTVCSVHTLVSDFRRTHSTHTAKPIHGLLRAPCIVPRSAPYRIHPVFASLSDARPSISPPFVCSACSGLVSFRTFVLQSNPVARMAYHFFLLRVFSSSCSVSFGRLVVGPSPAYFWLARMQDID